MWESLEQGKDMCRYTKIPLATEWKVDQRGGPEDGGSRTWQGQGTGLRRRGWGQRCSGG